MSESKGPHIGTIAWTDLTVPDAEEVKEFYAKVVGWKVEAVDMEGYDDFCMIPPNGEDAAAGICHARGSNANLPPQWLVYIIVENVERSAALCKELGGQVLVPPRELGEGVFCVIRDPAGAVAALYTP